jgi:hypothetical protein
MTVGENIKQSTYEQDSQEPVFARNPKPIQEIVRHTFDVLNLAFGRVLVLEMRFRLSVLDTI